MSINITMPALSPTMEEGKLAKWHVKEGDTVASGDVIAEIETDKATMEVEAVDEGKIGKIVVPEGAENVKVNAVIAVLLQDGESAGDVKPARAPAAAPPAPKAEAKPPATDTGSAGGLMRENSATQTSGPGKAPSPGATAPTSPPKGEEGGGAATQRPLSIGGEGQGEGALAKQDAANGAARIFASPLARRLAKDANIELSALTGSGPHGRIVKSDVEGAKSGKVPLKTATPAAAATTSAPAGGFPTGMTGAQVRALYPEGSYEAVPNDGMRRVVAQRLTEAKQTIPHFYLTLDCRIDELLAAREEINRSAPMKDGKPVYKLSLNDFVVKAWALALQKVPQANATWAGDAILYHKRSDVAVAVAVPGGLFTPVVRGADGKTLRQISEEVRDYATRARSKRLSPGEYQGGSSAISNLGMYGIKQFEAVINPPHATILAVGAGEERVYADHGAVKTAMFMTVTLSTDHRAVDGALGAELLGAFKSLIEHPVMMLA